MLSTEYLRRLADCSVAYRLQECGVVAWTPNPRTRKRLPVIDWIAIEEGQYKIPIELSLLNKFSRLAY